MATTGFSLMVIQEFYAVWSFSHLWKVECLYGSITQPVYISAPLAFTVAQMWVIDDKRKT